MSKLTVEENFITKITRVCDIDNVNKIQKSAVKQGLNVLKKQTKSNLRKSLPASTKASPLYSDKLVDAVRTSVEVTPEGVKGKVHVMGTRASTSGTFRTRFFEGGTVERIRKDTGKSTGHIKALNFFSDAVNTKEAEALQKVDEDMSQKIQKLFDE